MLRDKEVEAASGVGWYMANGFCLGSWVSMQVVSLYILSIQGVSMGLALQFSGVYAGIRIPIVPLK